MKKLIDHILAMKDDAYLTGHPEWEAIVKEAEMLKLKSEQSKFTKSLLKDRILR